MKDLEMNNRLKTRYVGYIMRSASPILLDTRTRLIYPAIRNAYRKKF